MKVEFVENSAVKERENTQRIKESKGKLFEKKTQRKSEQIESCWFQLNTGRDLPLSLKKTKSLMIF